MSDMRNMYETMEVILNVGVQKSKQRIDHTFIKAFLAGVFLSYGALFLLIVGGGSGPLDVALGAGIQKMIQSAVFPIGLILIVINSAELFTGNTMVLTVSTLQRETTWLHLVISWTVSYFGNLAGSLFCEGILVYYGGLLSNDPYLSFAIKIAETKANIAWHQVFLRGIGANWLVCLGVWMTTSARDLHSKAIAMFLPAWIFVSVGFEHCIANMFIVQVGMMLGAKVSVGQYIARSLIPVTIGNIVGGAFFVGFVYWYLYAPKKEKRNAITKTELPDYNSQEMMTQSEETAFGGTLQQVSTISTIADAKTYL